MYVGVGSLFLEPEASTEIEARIDHNPVDEVIDHGGYAVDTA